MTFFGIRATTALDELCWLLESYMLNLKVDLNFLDGFLSGWFQLRTTKTNHKQKND